MTKIHILPLLMILLMALPLSAQEWAARASTDHFEISTDNSEPLPGWITRLEALHKGFAGFWGEFPPDTEPRLSVYLISDKTRGLALLEQLGLTAEGFPVLLTGIYPDDDILIIPLDDPKQELFLALYSRAFLRRRFGALPEGILRGFSLYAAAGEAAHDSLADSFRPQAAEELPFDRFLADNPLKEEDILLWAMAVFYAEAPDSLAVRNFREYLILRGRDPRYGEKNPEAASQLFNPEFRKEFSAFWNNYPSPRLITEKAIGLYKNGDFAGAEALLKPLLPARDYRIPYYLGLIALERKQYRDALPLFTDAEQLKAPEDLVAYATGVCLWHLGEREKGKASLNRAAKLNPELFGERVYRLTGKKDS